MTEINNNNNVRTFSKNYTDVSSIQHVIINGEKKLFGWSLKFLYGYLLTFQENTGGAVYPSEKRIAEDLGAGIKTISKHLKGLEELGLVKKESRKGLSNIYYVLDINEVVGFKTDLTGQLKGTRYERAEQPLEQVNCLTNAKVPPKPVSAFIEAKSRIKPQKIVEEDYDGTSNPEEACEIYLQRLYSPVVECLKVGISVCTEKRMSDQMQVSSFKHEILRVWRVKNKKTAFEIESVVKKKVDMNFCKKGWMPDGYTETSDIQNKELIVAIVEREINLLQYTSVEV